MTKVLALVRGPWAIAMYTLREGMRKKTLIGFLILSLLVIFGSNFITAFLQESVSQDNSPTDVDVKIIKDICITAISIFGILITIFISASVVPTEVDNKVVYTILSKPLRRFQYLAGKFIGIQLIVLINLVLMGVLFFFAIFFKEGTYPFILLPSLLLTYCMFLIVSAFTFAISCTSSSSVLPTIAGLFIYITGLLTEYLKDVYERAGQTGQWLDEITGKIAFGLYHFLPNLSAFSLSNQVIYSQPIESVLSQQLISLVLYSLIYASAGYIIAYWIFRRKEL